MKEFKYALFSPAGNDTVFLFPHRAETAKEYCADAMKLTGAEQAAIADLESRSLRMAGDEFCLNACRAFGAALDFYQSPKRDDSRKYEITASGTPEPMTLLVAGRVPLWSVTARLGNVKARVERPDKEKTLVVLEGIAHLLIRTETFPENHAEAAAKLRRDFALCAYAASGVVWWRRRNDVFEIWPNVEVRDPFTSMLETSCASASLALALAPGNDDAQIAVRQPGGAVLRVSLKSGEAEVTGPVELRSEGRLWLKTDLPGNAPRDA